MGILTDVFVATEEEMAAADFTLGVPTDLLPVIEAKGVDTVPLGVLNALVSAQHLGDTEADVQAFVAGLERDFPCVRDLGEHWVHHLLDSLTMRLAQFAPTEIERVGAQWARTEELGGPNAATSYVAGIVDYLGRLCRLCAQAAQDDKNVYMWISL
ncbi:MAG TPA: hypothetical protein VF120_08760 [Ktedonobacterales bacterium]